MKKKAAIIDGHNFLFRGFYGVPIQAKRADGTQINAVYGFFSLLRKILFLENFDYAIVVFDAETSAGDKKTIRPEYKANRLPQDDSIYAQLFLIKKCLDIMGISWIEDEFHEADDIIGTYASKFNKRGVAAYICSNDNDFIQLVGDGISVIKGSRGYEVIYDTDEVMNSFSLLPSQYLDYRALVGDPSDNIKGVKGIGKKKGTDLLSEHGDLNNIYQTLNTLALTMRELLQENKRALFERREFLKIKNTIKLSAPFHLKEYSLSGKIIPGKMGDFLNHHWEEIIK